MFSWDSRVVVPFFFHPKRGEVATVSIIPKFIVMPIHVIVAYSRKEVKVVSWFLGMGYQRGGFFLLYIFSFYM